MVYADRKEEAGVKINIIEAKSQIVQKKRVAAYCRVSTDADEQENSLENQIRHYEDTIKANPEYEFVKVYYDFGISGFKEKRPGFQEMMQDARNGKIDLILTKSISRFARNTDIVLRSTRELKELNVGVFFELQNINTLTAKGELTMTIIAAFAQAESESGSTGAKMVYRRKYEAGIPVQYLERSFGYKKDEKGEYVPDEKEAFWVREIYRMVAEGFTPAAVKRVLNEKGVKTVSGTEWLNSTVIRLVENEIYKGDYIMHKHYVNAERKLVLNRGEEDSWYIENDHKPIVSKRLWQKAQDALSRKRQYLDTASEVGKLSEENYPYKEKLFCAECGLTLIRRVYSKGNRMNWGCSGTKRFGKSFCKGVNVPDSVVKGWEFGGNIYVYEKKSEKGKKEYGFYRESYWKRSHRIKKHISEVLDNTEENFPYKNRIFCRECGARLVRHKTMSAGGKIYWICNTMKRKGISVCRGVRVPDEVIRDWMPIEKKIYIKEGRTKNGEKHYIYTSTEPK